MHQFLIFSNIQQLYRNIVFAFVDTGHFQKPVYVLHKNASVNYTFKWTWCSCGFVSDGNLHNINWNSPTFTRGNASINLSQSL